MRQVILEAFGGPENLKMQEVAAPLPGAGEVLIHVHAAGVNYADVLWRLGKYPGSKTAHVLGFEFAGDVAALGEGVTAFTVGDRVFGSATAGGAYAEQLVVPATGLIPIPETITYEEAASIPVVFGTVYHALVTFGRVQSGETVLINAAGGGVGTIAVQWAKAMGARVVATAGSAAKLERVKALGADILINYREQELKAAVREATGGVDVVLESIGGQVLADSIDLLKSFGRLVTFGYASGDVPQINPMKLFSRNLTVSGLYLGAMRPERIAPAMRASVDMIAKGKVRPIIGHVFSLADVAEAHRLMEGRETFGKVILCP
jgi:NADPH2:quinone reductase